MKCRCIASDKDGYVKELEKVTGDHGKDETAAVKSVVSDSV